jgi:hypothetical protein
VRDTVLEALPGWRRYRYIIRIVNAPVGAGKDLLRVVWVNNNRIHRNIREIASLVRPREGATVGGAGYLENMTQRAGRVGIEAAYSCVAHGKIRRRHGGIKGNAEHWAKRHNGVAPGHIHPVGLCLCACAKIKTYPDIGIIGANHGHALILGRVLDLVDERTITQCLLGHVLGGRIVCYVPVGAAERTVSAQDCFPYSGSPCDEMTATAGHTRWRTIIAAWNTTVEKIVRQDERSCIAAPAAGAAGDVAAPGCILTGAVTDAAMKHTAVVTLPEAETRACPYGINARVESIPAHAQLP